MISPETSGVSRSALDFLSGGGDMGMRIREFDWSAHPLGPPQNWPQSLKPAVSLILSSRHPMWIGWGAEMSFLGGQERPVGILVAGINPTRKLDPDYETLFELIAGHVASAIQNARATEDARRRADMLAELDRAKTVFFSNVSHEFRTPLTLLLAPIEEILGKAPGAVLEDNRELLEVAHRNALRLQKLVNTLLDFSRLEAGRTPASYQPADLAALTSDLASSFRSACERAGLGFIIHCPRLSEPAYVDRDMWEKIVLNLVSTAFKYTLAGRIRITLREENSRAVLWVEDTGSGTPESELPRIFERFHRVEGARGRTQEGTGIGLALVQDLTRLHGGSVSVESVFGEGTTFTVEIPLGAAHLPHDRVGGDRSLTSTALSASAFVQEALRWLPNESPAVRSTPLDDDAAASHFSSEGRPRILLPDDNADMRDYVRRLLGRSHEVTAVADGSAALRLALERVPDLVLTDVMMPGLDGFGLLRALREDPRTREMPVILLSARAGEEARIEGLESGADDYLTKPFSAKELLARIEATLKLQQVRRAAHQQVERSARRLQTALNAARMIAWEWDLKTEQVV